jgi:hypothetical protein
MNKLLSAALALSLVAVGALAPRWWPPLLGLAGSHSSEIGGLASLVQLILWIVAGIVLVARPWRARKEKEATRPADPARVTRTYLEYLVEYYRYLDLRGMGVSDRVSLRLPLPRDVRPVEGAARGPGR